MSNHNESPTILTIASEVHRFRSVVGPRHEAPLHLILKGISDAALRQRVSVPIEFMDRKQCRLLKEAKHQPTAMQLGRLSGVIVTSEYTDSVLDAIGTRFPCVTVTRSLRPRDADSAGPEHLHGVERVVRYLHQIGHDRIGFVSLNQRPPWAVERYSGYLYAMGSLGLAMDPEAVLNVTGELISDSALAEPIVAATKRGITAWVCAADGLAREIYLHLTAAGFKVPSDVSLTGFDGIRHLPDCPPLTTIQVPWQTIGEGALATMLERIANPSAPAVHREYIGTFVEGETSAPPSKRKTKKRKR
ncbi:MAG: LacI family DNA-binding transcriptional regulator [Verrucomicrobia bacterium]|jgi:LacI family transcriptional regulator|nr:LacI family DNA-binding transcriptional regulator [Verrucomicrobiota bacterium]